MPALNVFRASAMLIAALGLAESGCGLSAPSQSLPSASGAQASRSAPPSLLHLPSGARPIAAGLENAPPARATAAGFEQPGGQAASGRILGLSATPAANSPTLIRQPQMANDYALAPPAKAQPVETAPIAAPPAPRDWSAPEPNTVQLPDLPQQPAYADDAPRAPSREYVPASEPAIQHEVPAPPAAFAASPSAAPSQLPAAAPQPQFVASAQPAADRTAMQPVAQRAAEISNHAYGLARRGMLYAARAELIQSLQLVAQALDVQHQTGGHAAALAAGVAALKESRDFAPQQGSLAGPQDVAEIARGHQTPVLKCTEGVSPVIAQQHYLAYAQMQLVRAAGNEPVASFALFRLGKVQMAMSQHESDPQMQHAPQAMVFYQSALAADERNYLAANELGVLMARYGQLQEARRLLVHSVSVQPHAEGWHNLSVVHQRLGETDLARRADHERQLLAQKSSATSAAAGSVAWVDPQTFAAAGGTEVPWSDNVVRTAPAAGETAQAARQPAVRGSASFGRMR
jgi:tetratricopeptide (TPR) repeat protein